MHNHKRWKQALKSSGHQHLLSSFLCPACPLTTKSKAKSSYLSLLPLTITNLAYGQHWGEKHSQGSITDTCIPG